MKELVKIFFLILIFSVQIRAQQQNCSQILANAQVKYGLGDLSQIIKDIESVKKCFNKEGFTKEERIRAYKLLTLAYIYNDDEYNAEKNLVNLLLADPEHELDSANDPQELYYLREKFRYKPIFRVGLKGGVRFTNVVETAVFGAENTSNEAKDYTQRAGFGADLTIEKEIFKGFDIYTGINGTTRSYGIEIIATAGNSYESTTTLNEDHFWLNVPVGFKYHLPIRRVTAYFGAGASLDYLASAKNTEGSRGVINTSEIDLLETDERNQINYSTYLNGGLRFKQNKNFIVADVKFGYGLTNLVNEENRYENEENVYRLAYVPNNHTLRYLNISVGYIRSIYNPKKLRKYKQ